MSGTMKGMSIDLMRLLSEQLNIGDAKPAFSLRIRRKDKQGGFEHFPFEIPGVMSITLDRRYNMAADELRVTIADSKGAMSPDYSTGKEYRNVRELPKNGFKDVLVPFNQIQLDLGYGDQLLRMFTGQITDVRIVEGTQALEITCRNMFRMLQKPIDPQDRKVLLYENEAAYKILSDLLKRAGCGEKGYIIDTETIAEKDFSVDKAEFQLGMFYSDAIQELLNIMGHRVFADRNGLIRVKKLELYTQKDFHVCEIDDYVNMTSGEYNMDSSFVRNRVIIQSNTGWQAFEDPFLTQYCNGEGISFGAEVPWAENEDQRWAVADKFFLDMRRKLRRITVAAKGNPALEIGDLVKMTGLISTMTEKYMVIGIQTSFTQSGYIDQIDLEYVGKVDGHICKKADGAYESVPGSAAGGESVLLLTTKRQQLVSYALSWQGTLYQWGGDCAHDSNHYGMDCSHFVWTVFEKYGLMEGYRRSADMYSICIPITKGELQPGDLVFYGDNSSSASIRHVGIYTGSGVVSALGNKSITTAGTARKNKKMVTHHPMHWPGKYQFYASVKGL